MSTVKASWSQLPAQGAVIEVCQDLPGNLLASSSLDGEQAYVQIWERDSCTGDWDLISQVEAPSPVSHLAWAHPESGPLLAGGTTAGSVVFWEAPRPLSACARASADDDMQESHIREWRQTAEVACGRQPVCALAFGPRQLGLTVATATRGGCVHVLEADRVMAPNSWTQLSKFQAGAGGASGASSSATGAAAAAASQGTTSLCWRPFSPGVAPLLAVAHGARVEVWQYMQGVMGWARAASLPASHPDAPVSSVHWAPTMGRPCELIAAARGASVDIVSLTGDTSALATELLATLEHSAPVWRLEFNMFGTCLAAATETNLVHLWKPDFVGKWLLVSVVAGSPHAAAEDSEDS